MKIMIFSIFLFMATLMYSESVSPGAFSITRIHYDGGGDWYADPSSLPNLLAHLKDHTNMAVNPLEKRAKIGDDIFSGSSYLYITGHGNIKFSDEETQILRDHLLSGAFLHADDNYGMDKSFRREMKKVFPEKDWVELPLDHPITVIPKHQNHQIHTQPHRRFQLLRIHHKTAVAADGHDLFVGCDQFRGHRRGQTRPHCRQGIV